MGVNDSDGYTRLPNGLKCFGKIVTKYTTSTSAPDATFDSVAGYDYGDLHVQTGANGSIIYMCTDPTAAAAIWEIFVGEGADTTNLTEHGKVNVVGGIDIGQPVYINDESGATKSKFGLGDRTGHDESHLAGLAKETKGNNQDIEVIRKGKLVGTTADPLNTSTFSDDPPERLHLGPSGTILGESPGGSGSHVEIGRCLRSHPTEGVIIVDIANYVHNIRAWSGGDVVLAAGDNGGVNKIKFEDYAGNEIGSVDSNGVITADGSGLTNIGTSNLNANFHTLTHYWNGAVLETISITATSDGATVTANLEKSGGGDLTLSFSDGFSTLDCTPAATVALTAGSDTSPQINYVYIPQSTKTLTASTTSFPSAEHIPVATMLVQSAASVQSDGVYKLHAWTDHVEGTDNQGHLSHLNAWVRTQHASWISGVAQTLTITPNGGAPDNVIFTTTAGSVYQLHPHTFPAFTGTPDLYVANDFTTAYNKVTDLNALLTDSQNVSMSGRYFSLVIWGSVNEATGDCKLFVNLPSGSYLTENAVIADDSKYSTYSIPDEFVGTGFLISELKLRHLAAASGTWTSIQEVDLRGLRPAIQAGSGVAGSVEFADNTFKIFDETDPTKEIQFQASGITTGNTRTITMADANVDLGELRKRDFQIKAIPNGTALTVTDNLNAFSIHEQFNGMDLVLVGAHVFNASSSGIVTLQIHRIRGGVDVLSTKLTIDVNEVDSVTAAVPAVIDTANDDVVTGDEYRIDCDIAGTGTLGCELRFTFA